MSRRPFSDAELEAYLQRTLPQRRAFALERALRESDELRRRLDAARVQQQFVEAVRDSFSLRLPDAEEDRIVTQSMRRLEVLLDRGGEAPETSR